MQKRWEYNSIEDLKLGTTRLNIKGVSNCLKKRLIGHPDKVSYFKKHSHIQDRI